MKKRKKFGCLMGFLLFLFSHTARSNNIIVPQIQNHTHPTTNFSGKPWKNAAIFTKFTNSSGKISTIKTKLYLIHNKKNLYVGFQCLNQNPKKLISNKRAPTNGDSVFFILDSFQDGLAAYVFGSNPKGNKISGVISGYSPKLKFAFSTKFSTSSKLTPNGYNVLLTIPFKQFPYAWKNHSAHMSFRAGRTTHQKQEFNFPHIDYKKSGSALKQYQTITINHVTPSHYQKPWFDINNIVKARKHFAKGYDLNTFIGRSNGWGITDGSIADYTIFKSHALHPSKNPTKLTLDLKTKWVDNQFQNINFSKNSPIGNLETFLKRTQTTAFIILYKGKIIYQKYFNGFNKTSITPSFSIAKSFLSALIGIAIEKKQIHSINDPITNYLPKLHQHNKHFEKITIKNLLEMSSGIRAIPGKPFYDFRKAYFSPNLRHIILSNLKIINPPGKYFSYNDYTAQLAGLILIKATHTSVTQLLQNEIWNPLGMQYGGSWSIDSKQDNLEQLAVGLNVPAIDYARFGLLYLQQGKWGNHAILPKYWVTQSTQPTSKKAGYYPNWGSKRYYKYFWWGLKRSSKVGNQNDFLAIGHRGQYIYISPQAHLVIVRTGFDPGIRDDSDWANIFYHFASRLKNNH